MANKNLKSLRFDPWNNEEDLSQTITKFMIESAHTCSTPHWCASVKVFFGNRIEYLYEFSSGGNVNVEGLESVNVQDRLHLEFLETFLGESGLPDVKLHTAEITLVVNETDGTRQFAIEAELYRKFAENFFRVVNLYPKRFYKGRCIKSGREFSY